LPLVKRSSKSVAIALEHGRSEGISIANQLTAVEILVACGLADEADATIADATAKLHRSELRGTEASFAMIERLAGANRALREADVATRIAAMGPLADRLMDADDEAVLCAAEGASTLLVVFGTKFNDFWVSYPVLHCLLPQTVSVLYLKDPREWMYLAGLKPYGPGFDALCGGVLEVARQLGLSDIRVTGFSSGGYAGLMLAGAIGARRYYGFSIRTDLRPTSTLPTNRYTERPDLIKRAGHMMRDLRPWLETIHSPNEVVLYYGDAAVIDAAHAEHLAGLSNVTLRPMPGARHNTIIALLLEGALARVLAEIVA
jgi:hypothetical protein